MCNFCVEKQRTRQSNKQTHRALHSPPAVSIDPCDAELNLVVNNDYDNTCKLESGAF